MLTAIVLRDTERAALSRLEVLGVEHLLYDYLSEIARDRKHGNSALLLAIKSADYLAPILEELGDEGAIELLDAIRESALGQTIVDRASQVAALTESAA
jgi:hypothetical protein